MFDFTGYLQGELEANRKERPTLIIPEAFDARVIQTAIRLIKYANLVIPVNEEELCRFAKDHCPQIPHTRLIYLTKYAKFIDIHKDQQLLSILAEEYITANIECGRTITNKTAIDFVSTPIGFSIMCTRIGYADSVIGGLQHQPRDFIRPALSLLKGKSDPYEVGFFMLPADRKDSLFPNNMAVFADIGVTTSMTPEKLANIAVGTCKMTRDLFPTSVMPLIHGVVVSYSTKGSDEGPSVELQREAAKLIPHKLVELVKQNALYGSITIETEVQVCYALNSGPVLQDNSGLRLTGTMSKANVIIAPNLDLGNFLYHSYASNYPDSVKFSQMGGMPLKIVEFAREARWEDILSGVKAHILRLWKYSDWNRTPSDYFFRRYKVLAINPGSTSTKVAVYEGEKELFTSEISHKSEELQNYEKITDQFMLRKEAVLKTIEENSFTVQSFDAVVARGGLLHPVESGIYSVNETMLSDLSGNVQGEHASNLGGLIANELVKVTGKPAFIVDPPVVDEVNPISRITGIKEIRRSVISHALSQIATAKRYAEENGVFYNELNLIVAHLGGGISVGAHHKGRYVDVNDALTGEGPFSPERSGSLPPGQLIKLCFSGKYSEKELRSLNKGKGGLMSLVGTTDFREVEKRYREGFQDAIDAVQAMAYAVAKEISSLIPAFSGETVDKILLTGGLAKSSLFVDLISAFLQGIGFGIKTYPGQNEMKALAFGALRALQGKEIIKTYSSDKNG